jgi:hypothetical protein
MPKYGWKYSNFEEYSLLGGKAVQFSSSKIKSKEIRAIPVTGRAGL